MNIIVLAIGRMRNPALAALCEDYAVRIRRYGHSLSIEEVREESGGKQAARILRKEAERLKSRLPEGAYSVALDRAGEACDSPGLACRLNNLAEQAVKRVVFLVGGHLGLDPALVSSCDWTLSLSPMTFPHELARLVLLEQIYRANTILRGEHYHK